jgi:hypothetical protein
MTDRNAVARVTRLSFSTDMTKPNAPTITLAFMLEAAWPDAARWLGLIARTHLTPEELARVNLMTWPELKTPPALMGEIFNNAWEGPWGDAGKTVGRTWGSSALLSSTEDVGQLVANRAIDTSDAWVHVTDVLRATLEFYGTELEPPVGLAKRGPVPSGIAPAPLMPIPSRDTRVRTDFRHAA